MHAVIKKKTKNKAIMILSSYLSPEHTEKNEHYHLNNIYIEHFVNVL